MSKKIAIIRIRGTTGIKKPIKDTLDMLHLDKKFKISIMHNSNEFMGMIKKIKDYVTYGEISEESLKKLNELRKNTSKNEKISSFSLHPPRGGLERKGSKVAFSHKGALGYRAEKINELIKKMM